MNIKSSVDKIFVGGFAPSTSGQELKEFFQSFGEVYSVTLKVDKKRRNKAKNCKGSAVIYMDQKQTQEILSKKTLYFNGKRLRCTLCLEGDRLDAYLLDLNQRRILLSGLAAHLSEADLMAYFSVYGCIENCKKIKNYGVLKENDKGFLIFKKVQDARQVFEQQFHTINGIEVVCQLRRSTIKKKKGVLSTKNSHNKKQLSSRDRSSSPQQNNCFDQALNRSPRQTHNSSNQLRRDVQNPQFLKLREILASRSLKLGYNRALEFNHQLVNLRFKKLY